MSDRWKDALAPDDPVTVLVAQHTVGVDALFDPNGMLYKTLFLQRRLTAAVSDNTRVTASSPRIAEAILLCYALERFKDAAAEHASRGKTPPGAGLLITWMKECAVDEESFHDQLAAWQRQEAFETPDPVLSSFHEVVHFAALHAEERIVDAFGVHPCPAEARVQVARKQRDGAPLDAADVHLQQVSAEFDRLVAEEAARLLDYAAADLRTRVEKYLEDNPAWAGKPVPRMASNVRAWLAFAKQRTGWEPRWTQLPETTVERSLRERHGISVGRALAVEEVPSLPYDGPDCDDDWG